MNSQYLEKAATIIYSAIFTYKAPSTYSILESMNLESVSTNAIYIIPVSMTLQRAATMQA